VGGLLTVAGEKMGACTTAANGLTLAGDEFIGGLLTSAGEKRGACTTDAENGLTLEGDVGDIILSLD